MLASDRSKTTWAFVGMVSLALVLTGIIWCLSVNHRSALLSDLRSISPAKTGPAKGFLWKATSKSNVVYLFGSYHYGNSDLYPFPSTVENAFRSSKALVTEINPTDADNQAARDFYLQQGYYPVGDSLERHLSSSDASLYRDFVHDLPSAKSYYLRLRPWRAVLVLEHAIFRRLNLALDDGADHYFLKLAKSLYMPAQGAETGLSHAEMLADRPESQQLLFLHSLINHPNRISEGWKAWLSAWIQGDANETLRKYNARPETDYDRQVLQGRNPHLTDVVETYLRGKYPAFVVYGALHFLGRDNIVQMLQKRGYTVERIPL